MQYFFVFAIVILFGLTRLVNNSLPLFLDEALYIRWVDTIASAPISQLYVSSVEDGQPPLFFWIASLIKKLLSSSDTLVIIRMVSIGFGFFSLLFGMLLAKELASKKAAPIFFGLLYVFSPFMTWYDRLGMRDSAMTFTFFSAMYFVVRWQKIQKNYLLVISGLLMCFGIFIKSIAWFIPIMLIAYLIFQNKRPKLSEFGLLVIPIIFALLIYVLTNTVGSIAGKNLIFIGAPQSILYQVKNNLYQSVVWMWQYLTPFIFISLVLSVAFITLKKNYKLVRFALIALIPVFVEIFIAKIFFPRYFLISAASMLVLLSIALTQIPRLNYVIFALVLTQSISWTIANVISPLTTSLPVIERWQYISGWPAGSGVKEIANYLKTLSPDVIYTEESDLLRTGIQYYQPSLKSKIVVLNRDSQPDLHLNTNAVVALHIKKDLPSGYNGTVVYSFKKPENGDELVVYKLYNQLTNSE